MKSLERILSTKALLEILEKNVSEPEIDKEEGKLRFKIAKLTRDRSVSIDLDKIAWGPLETVYESNVAALMIMRGYLIFPIEGGWIVVNPEGEEYQIDGNSCTCKGNSYNPSSRCSHLILRDWMLNYRARGNEYRLDKGY
ncbi:hypothetical protein H6G33_09400 [Calothrix sp. FACHB-1219]|uniref:hypothetical protein n=1 Tax=unclassified Calothrix TaxID=2619626 RepID=UPI001685BC72|nr:MULTISPECIES: hypothetical protein [unclassified Calothrix]MBD2201561.1 hypothetical protein [Calothrix sp. FACHB-168]MBD2217247.1 hypothetical protein [Calothrix sp. FACHB-1219]